MSASRPGKHGRPASTASRSPKRVKEVGDLEGEEKETVLSEMNWEEEQRRGRKRDNAEVEVSTEADSLYGEDGSEGDEEERTPKSAENKGRKEAKAARTEGKDSPSNLSRRGRGERQQQLKSAGDSKGKGKRVIDDSEDREIGEEWTDLNGLRWRMGDDGQVRREAVIVESRLKYPTMPRDSRHPDAKVMVPVLVERFLTEKEYEAAREKKLLSFQEMERQRAAEEAQEAARTKQEAEDEARRARAGKADRQVTTPKKIRDVQALFHSARKPSSPLRQSLPFPLSRSRSLSMQSGNSSAPHSHSVKRLSLSMGREEAAGAATSSELPAAKPTKPSTPDPVTRTPQRAKLSYRLPLTSPSSPAASNVSATSTRWSPVSDIKAKRKREENLLKLLQEESERRKRREEHAR